MSSRIKINERSGRFELEDAPDAFIRFDETGNTLHVRHTQVPERLRGQGIASELADFVFRFARDHKLKLSISCPFVMEFLQEHPDYQELVQS